MKDFSEHSNSELISLLLDGQLDKGQEKVLYQNISGNSEMQEELQELLSIRESVKKDYEAYNPPAELTNKVFAGLGYSSPFGSAANTAVKTAGFLSAGLFRRVLPYVALVVTGLSVIVFNQFNDEDHNDLQANTIQTAGQIMSSASVAGNDNLNSSAANSEMSISEENNSVMIDNRDNATNTIANNVENPLRTEDTDATNIPNDDHNVRNNLKNIDAADLATSEYTFGNFNENSKIDAIFLDNKSDFNSYWYAQALGIFAGSMAADNLPTQSSTLWSNINFGIFRQLTHNLSLGIQFGMEPYNIYETDNNDVPFLNSKDVFWVTAAGRYDMNFFSSYNVTPYISLAAGSSTVGFMSRGMAGLSYNFEQLPVCLNFGYEASMINYSIYRDYTSTKNGFVAGFNVRF